MGLIVLSVAILPLLGVGGSQIIKAETTGPLKEHRLTPRIADTAKALYIIYLGVPSGGHGMGRRHHAHDDDRQPLGHRHA